MTNLVLVLVIVAMVIGAAGTILPVLPGIPLIFIAALLRLVWRLFRHYSPLSYSIGSINRAVYIIQLLINCSRSSSFWLGKIWQHRSYARFISRTVFVSTLGDYYWTFLGAFIGEFLTHKDSNQAFRASIGALIGLFSGIVFNLLIALGMVISFIIKVI